jgi:PAS domain S-box-containing protein
MSVHQKIGKKIRIARKLAGMTQSELAKKLGKTGAAIAYLEQGKRRISTDVLTVIAQYTSKPLSFFYEEDGDSDRQMKKQLTDLRTHLDGIKLLLDEAEKEKEEKDTEVRLFRAVLDKSSDAIIVWDPETGKAVDCNEKASSGLGYTREDFLKKTVMEVESGIPTLEVWRDCVKAAKNKSFIMKTFPVAKNGDFTPVEVSVNYVTVEDRAYMVSMARFLEERKQQMDMADARHQRNRVHLESFSMGVFFADVRGSISEVNSVIWDILEIPPESRSENDFSLLNAAMQLSGIFKVVEESLRTLRESEQVFRFDAPWQKNLQINVRIIPIQYLGYVMGVQGLIERVKKGKG